MRLILRYSRKKEVLGSALADFCDALKRMRDTKLYTVYGFDDFGGYCEAAHGIKSRMAYKYIKAYEDCGRALMEQNAQAGITKLALLSEISANERADFAVENDLEGMSVSEVKAKLQEITGLREQLSFYESAEEKEKTAAQEKDEQLAKLRAELAALKAAPIDTVATDADALAAARAEAKKAAQAEIDKLKADVAKAKEKAKAEKDKADSAKADAVAAAKKQALAEAEKEATAKAEMQVLAAKEAAEAEKQRAEALAKELKLVGSKESTKFALYFEQMQTSVAKMRECADALAADGDDEQAQRLNSALKKALAAVSEGL